MPLHPLHDFVRESWRIESVFFAQPKYQELAEYHAEWISRPTIGIPDLEEAAVRFSDGKLRPDVPLKELCNRAHWLHPFELHVKFMRLNAFTRGNGQVGCLWWLKRMRDKGLPAHRGFLHQCHLQALGRA
jgi:hypothetical protein